MYKIELDQFSGPLDLLLQLIEGQKFSISQVSLAQVTDQYLAYIEDKEISATELADFLVVATKLLVIKSKILLPQLADEEEDSAEQLENQLKIYKDYLEASKVIEGLLKREPFSFSREKLSLQLEPTFSPPQGFGVDNLQQIFLEILNRISYVVNLPQKVMEKVVSLREMVTSIKASLEQYRSLNFRQIVDQAQTRSEAVVCFIALLELIKKGEVAVTQKGVFDDILVERVN